MALESFYGGKPGFSPVIKARFKYINDEDPAYQDALTNGSDAATLKEYTMDECFKDVNYTDVWYGELCIIDAENKMNPNNGKLYRRTLKKLNDDRWTSAGNTTYAEYIGQIVGPSGGVPNLDLGSLDSERLKATGQAKTYNTDSEEMSNANWNYAYPDDETGMMTNRNPGTDISKIKILDAGGINGQNIKMVPGKDGDTYYDTIRYTWCNVRRTLDNSGEDAWIYLGFQIPYTVFETTDHQENYTYNGPIFIDNSPSTHPFYKNYAFHIPRGARGIGPEQIFTINPKDPASSQLPAGAILYAFDAINYNQETDTYSIDSSKTKEVNADASYWVGKWNLYNPKTDDVTTIYQYLGSYKDVRKVELEEDGTLIFTYSDNSSEAFDKKIKWITSIMIDTVQSNNTYGTMTINYNNGTTPFTKVLPFIKSINFDDSTGEITTTYADGTTIKVKDPLGEDFTFIYPKTATINVDRFDSNYGQFQIKSNTSSTIFEEVLPLVKNITYNNDETENNGKINVLYAGNPEVEEEIGDITYIKSLIVDNNTQEVKVINNKRAIIQTSAYLNIAKQFWLDPRGHLLALYNSTYYRPNSDTQGSVSRNSLYFELQANPNNIYSKDQVWVRGTETNKIATNDDSNWWHDLGLVRGNAIAGVVYTLKNENVEDWSFASEMDALAALQSSEYQDSDSTTIGGNGNGHIKVNGEDVTGGLVSAKIKQGEGASEKIYSVIFYYDVESESWINAGSIGNSDGGNKTNVYIVGTKTEQYSQNDKGHWPGQLNENDYTTPYGQQYPSKQNNNPEIYFIDTRQISKVEFTSIYEPGGYKRETVIFPYIDDEPIEPEDPINEEPVIENQPTTGDPPIVP